MVEQAQLQQATQVLTQAVQEVNVQTFTLPPEMARVLVNVGNKALDELAAGVANVNFGGATVLVKLLLPIVVTTLKNYLNTLVNVNPVPMPAPAPAPQPVNVDVK
jgi:hypothetical protein